MKRLGRFTEKIVLGACVLLFLASALWATLRFRRLDEIAALNPSLGLATSRLEPAPVEVPEIGRDFWPEPPNQSRGSDWVYDVFTPPVLYYDPTTREFTVTRPELNLPQVAEVETPFEIELVAVKQEQYRIQLLGYQGKDGDYAGLFEIAEAGGAIVLARSGSTFGDGKGDFTVRSFEVRRVTTPSHDSMPVVEDVGFATILDGRTGREVSLRTTERLMMPRLQCVVRTRSYPVEEHTLREGMKITVNGYDYLITQLSLNPAQAVVSRRPPNSIGGAELRTLTPVGGTASGWLEEVDNSRLEAGGPRAGVGGGISALYSSRRFAPLSIASDRSPVLPLRDISIDSPRVSLFPNLPPQTAW